MPISANLPATFITVTYDSIVRIFRYVKTAERQSKEFMLKLDAHPEKHLKYRLSAHALRNTTLDSFRKRISPFGRAFSEALKEEGKTIEELTTYYQENPRTGLGNPGIKKKVTNRSTFRAAVLSVSDALKEGHKPYDIESSEDNPDFWQAAAERMSLNKLLQFNKCSSEEVSRLIIAGSGRTNKLVNIIAKTSLTTGIILTITGGVMTVFWFGFNEIPRELADWSTFPTLESGVKTAAMTIGGLGSGLVARGAGHCISSVPFAGLRLTGVTVTHITFLALFLFLWTAYIGPLFQNN